MRWRCSLAQPLLLTDAATLAPLLSGTRIVGIGKAGNPDCMDGVTPGMVTGVTTDCIAGEKMIITAGAIDTHVHWICPQIIEEAIASGITTLCAKCRDPALHLSHWRASCQMSPRRNDGRRTGGARLGPSSLECASRQVSGRLRPVLFRPRPPF
eukprot:scaffold7904_cov103-Isochrysis_galbana.AAC.6